MSLPGSSPNQTYWAAIGWNNGYMGMQTWATKRVFLFSLWDNSKGDSAVIEACSECVTSHFGGEGTGVHIQYFYPWADGVDYGFRVDYEEDAEYLIYTAHLQIDDEWMVFGKLRVINHNLNGLGYFYQFLENPQSVGLLDTRAGVWSHQSYRYNGGDRWLPAFGGSTTYTTPAAHDTWGAGITENQTAIWMSINGPAGNPYDNKPHQWEWFPYDMEKLDIDIVVANQDNWRCGMKDDVLHQCPPDYCCSSYGWCGTTDAYCKNSKHRQYDSALTTKRGK
ncbi:hypothetical protein K493DRAFT_312269 [Basidiobolus meristosporus CBS 931.73]|uniref:Chitin-binding type-1 domain-containing protein n=1 Tax=Basidiobolus meristosporus CBS 931.73 TaxID=1314790 RepID=A0A1Y1YV77_9FUNG|nr:hypothetical protein K493DRAFT_312269 [Basidiobolus meristosporus CBS 931.73]|eukprot:ORY01879.1 hypothetical protein K493DRAFT_312269 [Basidiobolus meristosporus CBS 931.73]